MALNSAPPLPIKQHENSGNDENVMSVQPRTTACPTVDQEIDNDMKPTLTGQVEFRPTLARRWMDAPCTQRPCTGQEQHPSPLLR
jgi:hypothetical protein